jgi:hypothetical protein
VTCGSGDVTLLFSIGSSTLSCKEPVTFSNRTTCTSPGAKLSEDVPDPDDMDVAESARLPTLVDHLDGILAVASKRSVLPWL